MSAPDFEQIKQLFLAASELPIEQRAAFLDTQEGLEPESRARVEAQLARLHRSESAILPVVRRHAGDAAQRSETPTPSKAPNPDNTAAPTESIDGYKLLQRLGEGGFGVVWMAEQLQPVQRKVAVKVIKLGMDTKQVVARFEAERQALALMDHPNIARVFDGGATASGRPYFTMELVRGIPITDYCDQARLGIRARLELFRSVCLAVQHAHQKGVIHRDLKPGNVLVTQHDGEPVAKVIDFGIAKATSAELTQKTMFTELHQLVGTPDYMAPEQAELSILDVDTRADIYSLGVLLYELLTGEPPFRCAELLQHGYAEMLRVIREDDPQRPSTRLTTNADGKRGVSSPNDARHLSRVLQRDVDWIVMKALEKKRDRRYETASAMAADIRRYLRDEAVLASPPTTGYRLRKLAGRYRLRVATAAVMLVSVLAAAVFSTSYAIDADAERDASAAARASLTSLVQVMQHADPFLSDDPRVRPVEALDQAESLVASAFPDQPHAEIDIRKTLGTAYWRQGQIRAASTQLNMAADLLAAVPDATAAQRRNVLIPREWILTHLGPSSQKVSRFGRLVETILELLAGDDREMQRTARELVASSRPWRFPMAVEQVWEHWRSLENALAGEPVGSPRWTALADLAALLNPIGFEQKRWKLMDRLLADAERIYLGPGAMNPTHMHIALLRDLRVQGAFLAGDLAGVGQLSNRSLATFAPVLPKEHWLLAQFRGWQTLAAAHAENPGSAVIERLLRTLDELETALGPYHRQTMPILTALLRNSGDSDARASETLRTRLIAVPISLDVDVLEQAIGEPRVIAPIRALDRLSTESAWPGGYRQRMRNAIAAALAPCKHLSATRRTAIARWSRTVSSRYLEKAIRQGLGGDSARDDLRDLYEFQVDALHEDPVISGWAMADLAATYAWVDDDRDRAIRLLRVAAERDDSGSARVVLARVLRQMGKPMEAVSEARRAYRQLRFSRGLAIDLYVDYGHRELLDTIIAAGAAQDELGAALKEAAASATRHLGDLLRGGATADSLNMASWAIASCQGLEPSPYRLAARALREALGQSEGRQPRNRKELTSVLNSLALALIRTGRCNQAETTLRRVIDLRRESGEAPNALDHLFLAMTQHGLGHPNQASRTLAHARSLRSASSAPVTNALFAEATRRIGRR